MPNEPNEWDRLPGEPAKWHHIFHVYYLPLGGDRTLEAAYRNWRDGEAQKSKAQRPNPTWYRAFTKWHWASRAAAWDASLATKALAETENEIVAMKSRHIRAALLLQQTGLKRLETLAKGVGDMSASEVLRFLKEAIDIERQARGLPKEILETWNLTDEQVIAKYQELYTGLAAVGSLGSGDAPEGYPDPSSDRDT